jgi:hypothetical protein
MMPAQALAYALSDNDVREALNRERASRLARSDERASRRATWRRTAPRESS